MTTRAVHLSHAPEDAAEIAPLLLALAAQNIHPNASPEDCALFLACCSSRGTYATAPLRSARERQLTDRTGRTWLMAIRFGAAPLPEPFHGLPVIAFHEDPKAALAQIVALLPAEPAGAPRTELQVTNILASDVFIENKASGSPADMSIRATGDIVGDKTVVFRNG